MDKQTRRPCPLCGAQAAGARILFVENGEPVLFCRACGMMYLDRKEQETDATEAADYVKNFCAIHDNLLHAGSFAANSIIDSLGQVASLLEVGIGVGALAQQATRRGIDYWCVEPSRDLVRLALDKGLVREEKSFVAPIEEVELPQERFDAVVLNMVLEHLLDPVSALAGSLKSLKPGGVLYLEVPNSRLFTLRTRVRKMLGMTSFMAGHINFFTPATIRRCLAQAGMTQSRSRIISNFRRGEGEAMVSFYKEAAGSLRIIDRILRRFPLDEALGVATILCCCGRKKAVSESGTADWQRTLIE